MADETAVKTKKVDALRVVSRPPSFNRAGFRFTGEPTDLIIADLSKVQIAALRGEPLLVVSDVKIDAPVPAAADGTDNT